MALHRNGGSRPSEKQNPQAANQSVQTLPQMSDAVQNTVAARYTNVTAEPALCRSTPLVSLNESYASTWMGACWASTTETWEASRLI